MKKILFSLALLFASVCVFADPHDCMNKDEAEALAQKILNQYIIDYCDCCEANNDKADLVAVSAKLLLVTKATVVPCTYDETRYSVTLTYTFVSAYNAKNGKLSSKGAMKQINSKMHIATTASLNYHFYLHKGKAETLYGILSKEIENKGCWGLDRFPTAKEVGDAKYKDFLAKQPK